MMLIFLKILLCWLIGFLITFPISYRCHQSIFYMDKGRSNKHARNIWSNRKYKIDIIVSSVLFPFFWVQILKDSYKLKEKELKRRSNNNKKNRRY